MPAGGHRRRTLAIALAALLLTATALAASALDVVPGVRIQRVERLPEIEVTSPPFSGIESTLADAQRAVPFELLLPGLGEPDTVLLDRDRSGTPVVTSIYGGDERARLVLTQWAGGTVLFDKLLTFDSSAEFVDVDGASGIWIEDEEHAVFYLGASGAEDRIGGYLTGNVLVWQRGPVSYRLEAGISRERALELARSLRPG